MSRPKLRTVRFSTAEDERFLAAWAAYQAENGACSQEQFIREACGVSSIAERGPGRPRGRRPRVSAGRLGWRWLEPGEQLREGDVFLHRGEWKPAKEIGFGACVHAPRFYMRRKGPGE